MKHDFKAYYKTRTALVNAPDFKVLLTTFKMDFEMSLERISKPVQRSLDAEISKHFCFEIGF